MFPSQGTHNKNCDWKFITINTVMKFELSSITSSQTIWNVSNGNHIKCYFLIFRHARLKRSIVNCTHSGKDICKSELDLIVVFYFPTSVIRPFNSRKKLIYGSGQTILQIFDIHYVKILWQNLFEHFGNYLNQDLSDEIDSIPKGGEIINAVERHG